MFIRDRSLDYPLEWLSEDARALAKAVEEICVAASKGSSPDEKILRTAKVKAGQVQVGIAAWQNQEEGSEKK